MKKSLLISLIVILVLGLSSAVLACHPCGWTDQETTTVFGNTGSVDITTIKTLYFDTNLQPGEQLCVCWWVRNDGKCPVKVKVTLKGVPHWLKATFYPDYHFKLKPGYKKQVALCIYLPCNACQNRENLKFAIDVVFDAKQDQHRFQYPCIK